MINKNILKKLKRFQLYKNYKAAKKYYSSPVGLLYNNKMFYWGISSPNKELGRYIAYRFAKVGVACKPFQFINLGFINKNPRKIIKSLAYFYISKTEKEKKDYYTWYNSLLIKNHYALVVFPKRGGGFYGVPLPLYIKSLWAGKFHKGPQK